MYIYTQLWVAFHTVKVIVPIATIGKSVRVYCCRLHQYLSNTLALTD